MVDLPKAPPMRDVLPIPDVSSFGAKTFDARDPESVYPPITPTPTFDWRRLQIAMALR